MISKDVATVNRFNKALLGIEAPEQDIMGVFNRVQVNDNPFNMSFEIPPLPQIS
jgi:hypothetical protein